MKKRGFTTLGIVILGMVILFDAKAQTSSDKESARVFVQKFYDWYAVMDADDNFAKQHNASPFAYTVKHKATYLDAPLYKALTNYFAIDVEEPGLDFDPISAAQDTRSGFETGAVKQVGKKFFVELHDIKKGATKKAVLATPVFVTAEVVKTGNTWKFTNFIYPGKSDLLRVLEQETSRLESAKNKN